MTDEEAIAKGAELNKALRAAGAIMEDLSAHGLDVSVTMNYVLRQTFADPIGRKLFYPEVEITRRLIPPIETAPGAGPEAG